MLSHTYLERYSYSQTLSTLHKIAQRTHQCTQSLGINKRRLRMVCNVGRPSQSASQGIFRYMLGCLGQPCSSQ